MILDYEWDIRESPTGNVRVTLLYKYKHDEKHRRMTTFSAPDTVIGAKDWLMEQVAKRHEQWG